jgi:hypothetical protein
MNMDDFLRNALAEASAKFPKADLIFIGIVHTDGEEMEVSVSSNLSPEDLPGVLQHLAEEYDDKGVDPAFEKGKAN